MMPLQRVRVAESRMRKQVGKWTAEGAVKWMFFQSILQRVGIRQLPGICWYPAKCTGNPVNARWHRG